MNELKSLQFKITSVVLLSVNFYILKTLIHFNTFLSRPLVIGTQAKNGNFSLHSSGVDTKQNFSAWFHPLALDICLIELFYIQHSLLKKPIQKILQHWGIEYLERLVFNFLSASVLQILMHFWLPITSWYLWDVPMEPNSWLDWALYSVRSFTWLAWLGECLVLDITDLLGWKQVLYHFTGLSPPSTYRSDNFNQTLDNICHSGLIELSILLWATPTLSLDRLVCSSLLSLYVLLGLSGHCAPYVQEQRKKKLRQLECGFAFYGKCSPSKRVRFDVPTEKLKEKNS